MAKIRLDSYIVANGLAQSRERAKALIMAGQVYVKNQKCDKAGTMIDENETEVEVRGEQLRYVSRGGLKLEKAVEEFKLSLSGKTAMDIGASTGGFTDCMLQYGASKVFAVDVGYGQLPAVGYVVPVHQRLVAYVQLPAPGQLSQRFLRKGDAEQRDGFF